MKSTNTWKLQDAKARLSEVTIHGKNAVVISDPERFEVRPKPQCTSTMADFIEASKKFRGLLEGVDLKRVRMNIAPRPIFSEEDDK
jgi:hypothetical protein